LLGRSYASQSASMSRCVAADEANFSDKFGEEFSNL